MARFMDKVRKDNGCWIWTGSVASHGYGSFYYRKKNMRAHRASYLLHRGEIPSGQLVLHTCDVTACVNPDHLFLGTVADNVADRVKKGRSACGERQGCAKLTPEQVLEIRRLYPDTRLFTLARRFGVSRQAIEFIVKRETWKHI